MEPELHSTMKKGQFHDIRLLVSSGVDVNVRNSDGRTPLILCSFLSQEGWAVGIARMFLENGGLVGIKDKFGRNGLMYATIFQRLELINLYLKAVDFDVNETDRYGNNALFYAASSGNSVAMHLIAQKLIHFKLSVNIPNKWGMTPLMEACRLGYKECCSVLRNFGLADESPRDFVLGWNAQQWASERDREIEARLRKRSVYDKPWLQNSRGYHLSPVETLSSSLSSSTDSLKTRSMTPITPCHDETETTVAKLPMLKCKRKIKIEKIRKDWINEIVKKETIYVKYQPSPSNYAVLSANTAPGGTESRKQMKTNSLKDRLDDKVGQPWMSNFKHIFSQYEMQVTGSYRRAAAAPPAQNEAALFSRIKGGTKENPSKDDKKYVLKPGAQQEGKQMTSWPSLSSVTSSRKSKAADLVEVFLASARTKKDRTNIQEGDSAAKTKDITNPRRKQIRLNKLLQDKI